KEKNEPQNAKFSFKCSERKIFRSNVQKARCDRGGGRRARREEPKTRPKSRRVHNAPDFLGSVDSVTGFLGFRRFHAL
ncbi:hypothetical protein AAMO2058_001320700, partial [Amorphochlora amoebiformis]